MKTAIKAIITIATLSAFIALSHYAWLQHLKNLPYDVQGLNKLSGDAMTKEDADSVLTVFAGE